LASDGSGGTRPRLPARLLAFDTSAAQCAAALVAGESVLVERIEPMARGQAERLLPLLQDCLADAGRVWRDLDAIAVCTGPGNFTGVRIGVAAARGLSLATGLRAIGVTTFEALAASHEGHVLALVRNPRGATHAQWFRDGSAAHAIGSADTLPPVPPETLCIGYDAAGVALNAGLSRYQEMDAPVPRWIAAAARAKLEEPPSRPAPLYLRPADATPAAPAPVLLDDAR
jgi:tRNA threonylcarbamoyladenosine biosynthesis protein TsaB